MNVSLNRPVKRDLSSSFSVRGRSISDGVISVRMLHYEKQNLGKNYCCNLTELSKNAEILIQVRLWLRHKRDLEQSIRFSAMSSSRLTRLTKYSLLGVTVLPPVGLGESNHRSKINDHWPLLETLFCLEKDAGMVVWPPINRELVVTILFRVSPQFSGEVSAGCVHTLKKRGFHQIISLTIQVLAVSIHRGVNRSRLQI